MASTSGSTRRPRLHTFGTLMAAALLAGAVGQLGASSALAAPDAAIEPANSPEAIGGGELCDATTPDTTKWRPVDRGAFRMQVPRAFAIRYAEGNYMQLAAGQRRLVMWMGNDPMLFTPGDATSQILEMCQTEVDGRPAELVLLSYNVPSQPLVSPGEVIGNRYVVGARWARAAGGQDVAVWIDTPFAKDARQLRGVFWTMRFARDTVTTDGSK